MRSVNERNDEAKKCTLLTIVINPFLAQNMPVSVPNAQGMVHMENASNTTMGV
jgi:hypothetical protein